MAKYKVEITEFYQRTIEIEASDKPSALEIAEAKWSSCEVVLDPDDYSGKQIKIKEEG